MIEIYLGGLFLAGLPLMLRYLHVVDNENGDHFLTCLVIALLIVLFWPVGVLWFSAETFSVKKLHDDPNEDYYIFYDSNDDEEEEH